MEVLKITRLDVWLMDSPRKCEQPKDFEAHNRETHIFKLKKDLYGLK